MGCVCAWGWGGLTLGQLLESPKNTEQASCTSVYNHEHDTRPPQATLRAVSRLPSYHLLHVTMRTCTHIHAHSHMHTHSHAHTCTRAHSQTRHAVCLSPVPSRMEVGVLCSLACPDPGRPPAHRRPASLRMRPLRLQQLCLREGPRASSPRGPGHTLSPRSELRSCRAGLLWLQFLVAL